MAWKTGDVVGPTNLNTKSGGLSKTTNVANFAKGTTGVAANDNATAVNAAVASAVAVGNTYCFVPADYLPYNASLVTFNTGVKMLCEGGNPGYYDVKAYGAAADG